MEVIVFLISYNFLAISVLVLYGNYLLGIYISYAPAREELNMVKKANFFLVSPIAMGFSFANTTLGNRLTK